MDQVLQDLYEQKKLIETKIENHKKAIADAEVKAVNLKYPKNTWIIEYARIDHNINRNILTLYKIDECNFIGNKFIQFKVLDEYYFTLDEDSIEIKRFKNQVENIYFIDKILSEKEAQKLIDDVKSKTINLFN